MAVLHSSDTAHGFDRNEAPAAERPVDLVHLARVTLGERSLEREVLNLFRSQSGRCLARIEKTRDETGFREAVHAIKGSARGIGAWKVAELAAEIEEAGLAAADDGRLGELCGLVEEANIYIGELLRE